LIHIKAAVLVTTVSGTVSRSITWLGVIRKVACFKERQGYYHHDGPREEKIERGLPPKPFCPPERPLLVHVVILSSLV
jgi:hypothetical protein